MTSLLETVRVRNGRAPLWPLHLRRLARSCEALGVPFPSVLKVPAGGPDRVHRLEVGPGGVALAERSVPPPAPVRLVTTSTVHPRYPHKVTARQAFADADREAARLGGDAALLLTGGGLVAEASIWCLYWWEGDRIFAPALELGILEGVSRMRVEEIAGPVAERRVGPEALEGRPVFVSNAVRGIVEVERFGALSVPVHPGTRRLAEAFWP
ncbi:MAG: aminotransferase class IV [Gemmatimonadota bacterium]|nr:aminotransferase class IV [Gemmatimonadota bacterium]MDH5283156.1 aminotransferase class IV [Gemmatimonadota bacterium]